MPVKSSIQGPLYRLIPVVPGLGALVYGFLLPWEVQPLFSAGLSVLLFSTLVVMLLFKGKIRKWTVRRTAWWVVGSALGAILFLLLFFIAQTTLVKSFRYPPGSDADFVTLIPARIHLAPPQITYPYLDCREAEGVDCTPVPREASTSQEVADLLTLHGHFEIQLPTGGPRITATVILLVLYGIAAVQLVLLFGLVTVRGITLRRILDEFGTEP